MSYTATIGFFDGVHRGHQHLIGQLLTVAAERHELSMAVTFNPHPRQTLQPGWQPQLLSTLDEKRRRLLSAGIDRVEVLRFDHQMAQLSARTFMQWLHDELDVSTLLMGYDNHFGHGRTECFDDYVRYGCEIGIEVVCATPFSVGESTVSSSRIRQLLTLGDVEQAALCLGRPYSIGGTVVHGEQIGRRLGFPTANLQPDSALLMVPKDGVYAVSLSIDDDGQQLHGMTNIGTRPTFDGTKRTLETYIFDFDENLYGHHIVVTFLARLRDEQHFATAEALTQQMQADARQAQRLFHLDPEESDRERRSAHIDQDITKHIITDL